jgi:Zn-dependent protease/predicted transcriptional regulator
VLLHWSFGLLFAYILYIGQSRGLAAGQVLWLSFFVMAMFVCIVLHEFGHALTARRFGVSTRDIVLLPIGGMARLDKLPEKPIHEFLVAIAGPAVNVGIALFLSPYFFIVSFRELFVQELNSDTDLFGNYLFFVPALIFLNITLAVFNLLPAFPMDGGRVLRALLATKLSRTKATRIAATVGQTIAVAMFVFGLWNYNITTAFIGVFIFFTASKEYQWVRSEGLLSEVAAGEKMRREFTFLKLSDSILPAYSLLIQNREFNFLVFDENANLVGTLPNWALIKAMKNGLSGSRVREIYSKGFSAIVTAATLKEANEKFQQSEAHILPVFDEGVLVGVLDQVIISDALSGKKSIK